MALVAALMAWDHLWGNERGGTEPFPVDLGAFLFSMVVSFICAGLIFFVLVPRTHPNVDKAPRRAMWLSGLAVPLTLVAAWLGFPLVLAGGGITLGLLARASGTRSRLALAAIAVGLLVLALGVAATAFPAQNGD